MPTIDALVEGKQIGTIKVTRPGWDDCWFRPCYVTAPGSGNQWWYGLRENGVSACYVASDAGWELWQEPAATRTIAHGFELIASECMPENLILIRHGGLLYVLNLETGNARSMEDMTEFARGFLKFKVPEFEK